MLRNTIKKTLTLIRHPIMSYYFMKQKCKMFSIGPRLNARRLQHLTVGNNINIGSDARLLFIDEYAGQKYQPGLIIGSNVDIGNRFSALSAATITIGDGCLIASDVLITSENHGINPEGGGGTWLSHWLLHQLLLEEDAGLVRK